MNDKLKEWQKKRDMYRALQLVKYGTSVEAERWDDGTVKADFTVTYDGFNIIQIINQLMDAWDKANPKPEIHEIKTVWTAEVVSGLIVPGKQRNAVTMYAAVCECGWETHRTYTWGEAERIFKYEHKDVEEGK